MPVNEIPKQLNTETRSLIKAVLQAAWELRKGRNVEAKLRKLMGDLASVGETNQPCKPDEWTSPLRDVSHHTSGVQR